MAQLTKWHSLFKIMNAASFFERVTKDPQLLHSYTEDAAPHDLRDAAENRVLPKTARLLQSALKATPWARLAKEATALYNGVSRMTSVVDLGCGTAELAKEVAALYDDSSEAPEVVSVDAVSLAPNVVAANLACLPEEWKDRFQAAVLCRSLWARDYPMVLAEAKRVLQDSHHSCLIVVEPFLRWWGRSKRWPEKNALVLALQRSGFCIDWKLSSNTEPRVGVGGLEYAVFQYLVAYVEPRRCVVCRELPAHRYQHGFHLCINCEEEDAGVRPAPIDAGTRRNNVSEASDSSPPKCKIDERASCNHGRSSANHLKSGRMGGWDPKGFAFISPDDGGKDVFCHLSALEHGKQSVREGDACKFRIVFNERTNKQQAENVIPTSMERPQTNRSRSRTPLQRTRRHHRQSHQSRTPCHTSRPRAGTLRHHGHRSRTPRNRGRR